MKQPVRQSENNLKDFIEEICREAGPRPAGSAAEGKAVEIIRKNLEECGASVHVEEFPVVPRTVHALVVMSVIGYILSLALYFLWPPLAPAVLLPIIVAYLASVVFGKSIFAPFFQSARSRNVIGKIKPSGGRKRLLMFSAHHDSAFRMPLLARPTYRLLFVLLPIFAASIFVLLVLSLYRTGALIFLPVLASRQSLVETAALCFCGAGAAAGIALLAGTVRGDCVPGANDNLSGVAVALGVARRLSHARPENTEIWILSFGAEEIGLIGSRHFVRNHAGEIKDSVLMNLESFGQQGSLRVVSGELMPAVMHSREARALVARGAAAAGKEIRENFLPFGFTDAASFTRRGLRAATIIRLDAQGYLDHYHNPGDNPDSIREENLQEALEVCMKIVELVDNEER